MHWNIRKIKTVYLSKQPTNSMKNPDPRTTDQPTDTIDALLDKLCINPCYGDRIIRQVIRQVVLRRNEPVTGRSIGKPELSKKK